MSLSTLNPNTQPRKGLLLQLTQSPKMSLGIFLLIPILLLVGVFVLANWRTFITFAITPAILGLVWVIPYFCEK